MTYNQMVTQNPHNTISSAGGNAGEVTLSRLLNRVSVGVKGPMLASWANQIGLPLPQRLYDVSFLPNNGTLARVGEKEIILDCTPEDPTLAMVESSLSQHPAAVYRIEQQAAIFELTGSKSPDVLAQTCGVEASEMLPGKIVFTRVAGASCSIIVIDSAGKRTYRIRADYTLGHYLWETLSEIVQET